MVRILVSGSREWNIFDKIRKVLDNYNKGDIVIHSGCRGADSIAEYHAHEKRMNVIVFNTEWKKIRQTCRSVA